MSHRCRNCGRNSRRRHRTVFSQGNFWVLGVIVVLAGYLVSLARGQA